MSADNGILILKYGEDDFRFYEYCGSTDLNEHEGFLSFSNLIEALIEGTSRDTEYGIKFEDRTEGEVERKIQRVLGLIVERCKIYGHDVVVDEVLQHILIKGLPLKISWERIDREEGGQ